MTELARYRCPRCSTVYDVWLEGGTPTSSTYCPSCKQLRLQIRGVRDVDETELFGDGPAVTEAQFAEMTAAMFDDLRADGMLL